MEDLDDDGQTEPEDNSDLLDGLGFNSDDEESDDERSGDEGQDSDEKGSDDSEEDSGDEESGDEGQDSEEEPPKKKKSKKQKSKKQKSKKKKSKKLKESGSIPKANRKNFFDLTLEGEEIDENDDSSFIGEIPPEAIMTPAQAIGVLKRLKQKA